MYDTPNPKMITFMLNVSCSDVCTQCMYLPVNVDKYNLIMQRVKLPWSDPSLHEKNKQVRPRVRGMNFAPIHHTKQKIEARAFTI